MEKRELIEKKFEEKVAKMAFSIKRLERQSVTDDLTNLLNHRGFFLLANYHLEAATRSKKPFLIIFADVDNLKIINDTYGHLYGDFVLQDIANLVSGLLRHEQIFARVGGDEFSIISPETGIRGAKTLAEKIAESIADHSLSQQGVSLKVSCSFGVTEIAEDDLSSRDLYARADRAMYKSKNAGRNQVSAL